MAKLNLQNAVQHFALKTKSQEQQQKKKGTHGGHIWSILRMEEKDERCVDSSLPDLHVQNV